MAVDPFSPSSNPRLYVPLARDEAAIDAVVRALEDGAASVALIGPTGIGKSLLLAVLGERLRPRFEILPVRHPGLDPARLVAEWLDAREPPPEGKAHAGDTDPDRPLVLLVDEAVHLPDGAAEGLGRLLRETEGALRLVLAACPDPAFVGILNDIDPLAVPVGLEGPLAETELVELLEGRLERASADRSVRRSLAPPRLRELASESEGDPRAAIRLADHATSPLRQRRPSVATPPVAPRRRIAAVAAAAGLVMALVGGAALWSERGAGPAPESRADVSAGAAATVDPRVRPPSSSVPPEPVFRVAAETPARPARSDAAVTEPEAQAAVRPAPVELPPRVMAAMPVAAPPKPRVAPRTSIPAGRALPAAVPVVVNAVPAARISVDGEDFGATPIVRRELPAGTHLFRARFDDGRSVARHVRIEGEVVYLVFP